MEYANISRIYWIIESKGLLFIKCLLKRAMSENISNIELSNQPILLILTAKISLMVIDLTTGLNVSS